MIREFFLKELIQIFNKNLLMSGWLLKYVNDSDLITAIILLTGIQ